MNQISTINFNTKNMSNQLATIDNAVTRVMSLLPADFPAKAFGGNVKEIAFVLRNCMKNEKLAACTPESVYDCIAQADGLGLSFNPVLHHLYLVPYGNKCTLITGYKGKMLLALPDMVVTNFGVVRIGDVFEETNRPGFPYIHRKTLPKPGDDLKQGAIFAAYAVAYYRGHEVWQLLNLAELQAKAALSKSSDFRTKFPAEMHIKDAINALMNRYPITSATAAAFMDNEVMVAQAEWQEAQPPAREMIQAEVIDDEAEEIRQEFQRWYNDPARTDKDRQEVAQWKECKTDERGNILKRTPNETKMFLTLMGAFA